MPNPTIIVTGCSSFIGFEIAKNLMALGWNVIGISRTNSNQNNNHGKRIKILSSYKRFSIRNLDLLYDELDKNDFHNVKFIVHHAAYVGEGRGVFDEVLAAEVNTITTLKVIKFAKEIAVGISVTGSNAEYGNKNDMVDEDCICRPGSAYGMSKLCQTNSAQIFANFYNVKIIIPRIFNVLGYSDTEGKLLPSIFEAKRIKSQLTVGDGNALFDFMHVEQVAKLYCMLVKRQIEEAHGLGIVNICSGRQTFVRDLMGDIFKSINLEREMISQPELSQIKVPTVSYGNNSKLKALVGEFNIENFDFSSMYKKYLEFKEL